MGTAVTIAPVYGNYANANAKLSLISFLVISHLFTVQE